MSKFMKMLALTVGLLFLASACGEGTGERDGDPAGLSGLSGSINADGSSTVFPISQAIAEEFQLEASDVKVSVGTSGTGGGFEKFCAGETDLSNASRPIKEEEKNACSTKGIEFVELQVAIDGLSILVNPNNNFVKCLTVEELNKIWAPGSTVKNWRDVRSGFPDRPLTLYGPGTDSGTFDYFTEEINGESGASRSDYVASEDDNTLVQGISGDENALGYFGYAYYETNKNKLKTVQVDGGDGCVAPTRKTINNGDYKPLSRPLFVYVSKQSAARKEVSAFVDFYFDTVNDLIAEVGYVALPEDLLESEREEWETFRG